MRLALEKPEPCDSRMIAQRCSMLQLTATTGVPSFETSRVAGTARLGVRCKQIARAAALGQSWSGCGWLCTGRGMRVHWVPRFHVHVRQVRGCRANWMNVNAHDLEVYESPRAAAVLS